LLSAGTYVGKGIARADAAAKTNGSARYGIDTREPGQLYAAIRHSPRLGGVLQKATLRAGLPGVRGLVEGKDYVAVVASSYSKAVAGLEQADVVWNDAKALGISTTDVFAAYRAALDKGASYQPRWVLDKAGDAASSAGRKVAATYDAPFLAHATMEPMNATAVVTDNGVKVWAGHQSGYLAQLHAASVAGVSADAVEIVTPYLGGGLAAGPISTTSPRPSRLRANSRERRSRPSGAALRICATILSAGRDGRRLRDARCGRAAVQLSLSHRRSLG